MDANTWEATESKMTAGVMGKSKEMAGSEAETVVGTESGVDNEVGTDSKSRSDKSGAGAGAKASTRCAIATAGGDAGADMRLMVAGTTTGDDVVVVTKARVGPIVEMISSACAVANVWLWIAGMGTEQVG